MRITPPPLSRRSGGRLVTGLQGEAGRHDPRYGWPRKVEVWTALRSHELDAPMAGTRTPEGYSSNIPRTVARTVFAPRDSLVNLARLRSPFRRRILAAPVDVVAEHGLAV
jgi:hypothetical protein